MLAFLCAAASQNPQNQQAVSLAEKERKENQTFNT
jgi:hypothetical protein